MFNKCSASHLFFFLDAILLNLERQTRFHFLFSLQRPSMKSFEKQFLPVLQSDVCIFAKGNRKKSRFSHYSVIALCDNTEFGKCGWWWAIRMNGLVQALVAACGMRVARCVCESVFFLLMTSGLACVFLVVRFSSFGSI